MGFERLRSVGRKILKTAIVATEVVVLSHALSKTVNSSTQVELIPQNSVASDTSDHEVYLPIIENPEHVETNTGVNVWEIDANALKVMDPWGVVNAIRADASMLPDGTYYWAGNATVFERISTIIDAGKKPAVILHGFPSYLQPEGSIRCEPPLEENNQEVINFWIAAIAQARLNEVDGSMVIVNNEPEFEAEGVLDDEIMGCFGFGGGAKYGKLLGEAYPQLKEAYPNLLVGFAGLIGGPESLTFLEDAILAGAKFDVLNIHWYPYYANGQILNPWPGSLPLYLLEINEILAKYNLTPKIFLTETFLAHSDQSKCYTADVLKAQADYVGNVAKTPGLDAVILYQYNPNPPWNCVGLTKYVNGVGGEMEPLLAWDELRRFQLGLPE